MARSNKERSVRATERVQALKTDDLHPIRLTELRNQKRTERCQDTSLSLSLFIRTVNAASLEERFTNSMYVKQS